MSNNEIYGGLRNALERGEPIEKAIQTFINAGYNPSLVKQAAVELSSGVTNIINPEAQTPYSPSPNIESTPNESVKKGQLEGKTKKIVIGLIIGFIVLIAILLLFIFFGSSLFTN